ncbi:MAG: PDDEXK nuclease domain-containing protein [Paludibacteraceae bacterium]|nr:PDDEXK nuclease domain-containing protein [Paludibacteraceae bacterium]
MDNTGTILTQNTNYNKLVSDIGTLLNNGRKQMAIAVNTSMVQTYWSIGKHIVEFEQKGNERAEYGSNLINRLSRDLTERYGKGFGKSNLLYIRKFYLTFPKSGTVSHLLTWSHFYEILKKNDPMEISFYVKQCEIEGWSVRELKRQMQSMLFHRLALSKDKEQVLKLSHEGQQVQKPEDILRDPYVFDFVGLPETYNYTEKDLEDGLLKQFEMFLLELGRGFAFIGRQQRISLAGRHYYVDLVFYHRILKCFVLIDLKRGTIQHEDIGQMNLYINYYKSEMNVEGDNPPIGIVLGADADRLTMQYAMEGISNQLFAAKYQLYLPSREELQSQLDRIIRKQEKNDDK